MEKQVYQRWTWVFIYLLFNEVFEELCMAVTGSFIPIKHKAPTFISSRGEATGVAIPLPPCQRTDRDVGVYDLGVSL